MGGYVACGLAKLIPEKIHGLCLFHSSVRADSAAKKEDRLRAVELLRQNKSLFTRTLISSLFNPAKRAQFDSEVETAIEVAQKMSVEEICNAIMAMRNRPDNLEWMKSRSFPLYYFVGDSDARFSLEEMNEDRPEAPCYAITHVLCERIRSVRCIFLPWFSTAQTVKMQM